MIITIDGKSYETKRTMLRKETRHVFDNLSFLANLHDRITSATPQELQAIDREIKTMSPKEGKFIDDVIKQCFGFSDDDLDNMENLHILRLFSELYQESTVLKKNSSEQSKLESTGPTTKSS
jgi:hypothetical protein